jgi:hypothetical protein
MLVIDEIIQCPCVLFLIITNITFFLFRYHNCHKYYKLLNLKFNLILIFVCDFGLRFSLNLKSSSYFYPEIEFIKPLFTVNTYHTLFINKMINLWIMRMFIFLIIFIFIYSTLLAKCYAFAQMILIILV